MGKKKKTETIQTTPYSEMKLAELQRRRKEIEKEIDKLKKDRVEVIHKMAEARKQGG